jgi:hypothetical protein
MPAEAELDHAARGCLHHSLAQQEGRASHGVEQAGGPLVGVDGLDQQGGRLHPMAELGFQHRRHMVGQAHGEQLTAQVTRNPTGA